MRICQVWIQHSVRLSTYIFISEKSLEIGKGLAAICSYCKKYAILNTSGKH